MLALIGFIVLVLFGAFCLVGAVAGAALNKALSGKVNWPTFLEDALIGGACLWAAVHWAPFSISWVG